MKLFGIVAVPHFEEADSASSATGRLLLVQTATLSGGKETVQVDLPVDDRSSTEYIVFEI